MELSNNEIQFYSLIHMMKIIQMVIDMREFISSMTTTINKYDLEEPHATFSVFNKNKNRTIND